MRIIKLERDPGVNGGKMRKLLSVAAAITLTAITSFAQTTSAPSQINIVPPSTEGFVYPVIGGFTQQVVTVPIPAAAGTVVATPSIANSDGSAFAGTLGVSGDALFTVSGKNVVLARATTTADQNTQHKIKVTATEPGTNGASVSWALQPDAGSIPCDIGPPANAIPSEAQAAGFTHCALNLDFSQPLYAVSTNWANPNYWSAFGLDTSKLFFPGSAGLRAFPPQLYTQVYDPSLGVNVVNFHWDPVQNGNTGAINRGANGVGVGTWNQSINNWSGAQTWNVGNYYMDNVSRMKAAFSEATNAGCCSDVFMYDDVGQFEMDIPEFQTNQCCGNSTVTGIYANCANAINPPAPWTNSGFCSTNWGPNRFVGVPGYSSLAFHKYGGLRTSDGVTDTRQCVFLDDVMQGPACGPVMSGGAVNKNFTARSALYIGSAAGRAKNPTDLLVARITIWSCDTYKTSMCNGSSLVTQTTPNNQTETYYH